MPYNSIFHPALQRGLYNPALTKFLQNLEHTIENTALPSRVKEDRNLGAQTEDALDASLKKHLPNINWIRQQKLCENRNDTADFYADVKIGPITYACIIEADPTRGDAIAKKFLSRVACVANKPLIYITLCYEGTQRGTITESRKYMEYCCDISARLSASGSEVIYLGFMPKP